MLDICTAFEGTDSTIHAVIYIVLSIFMDQKLDRSTLFVDLNLEITESQIRFSRSASEI